MRVRYAFTPVGLPGEAVRLEIRAMVRGAREQLEMTQSQFAQALSNAMGQPIDQSRVSRWEAGQADPPAGALLAIADLTGGSIDALRSRGTLSERIDAVERDVADLRDTLKDREQLRAEIRRQVADQIKVAQTLRVEEPDQQYVDVADLAAALDAVLQIQQALLQLVNDPGGSVATAVEAQRPRLEAILQRLASSREGS